MNREYNPEKRGQFPSMAKLIKQKRIENGQKQMDVTHLFSGTYGKVAQFVSNCERGICTVPLKRAKSVCEFMGITKEEFSNAYLEDIKIKIERGFQ